MRSEGLAPGDGRVGAESDADVPFFCRLAKALAGAADSSHEFREHPRGEVLFTEGQAADGVYVLCRGRAKLYTCSSDARVLITGLAGPGDVLGLSAVVSGEPYEVSARTLDACRLWFVRRETFLRLLEERAGAAAHAARQLSADYRAVHRQAGLLGLAPSAAGKLASVLLGLAGDGLALTHEEFGQLIGASRETVTRLIGDFRRQDLIEVNGATLTVLDRPALEALTR